MQNNAPQALYLQRTRRYVAILASILVVFVLLITGFLNIGSFQKGYIDSLVSSYGVAGSEARRTIEYSIKYHKPLNNFAGINEILSSIKHQSLAVENVYIVLPNGKALYDLSGPNESEILSEKLLSKFDFSSRKKEKANAWLLVDHRYHALIPLRDSAGNWIASIDIVFSEESVLSQMSAYIYDTIKIMGLISIIAIFAVVFLVYRLKLLDAQYQLKKRGLTIALTLVLGVAQASFGAINVVSFRDAYFKVVENNLNIAADIISNRIAHVVRLGFSYQELDGVDDWLSNLVAPVKEIDHVKLRNSDNKLLFSSSIQASQEASKDLPLKASQNKPEENQLESFIDIGFPEVTRRRGQDAQGESAILSVAVSKSNIYQKLIDLSLDALTMFVVSIFFLVETLVFIIILLTGYIQKSYKNLSLQTAPLNSVAVKGQNENCVRVLGFLLLLCSYTSISFIPLLMKEIYAPLWGLSPSFIIALPIASEMFGAFVASLLVGHAIDKYGWRSIFIGGFVILALATLASGLVQSPVEFIFIRAIVGVGYGAAWMGLRGFVATGQTPHQRTHGFSILNAGIFAGQNCGAVLGALLAQRLGFSPVLILSSCLVFIAIPFTFLLTVNSRPVITGGEFKKSAVRRFFMDRETLIFFLLITIPTAVTSSFLTYFFPVFSNSINITQGDIGRGFLLYGICIIFVGPFLMKKLIGTVPEKVIILVSCFLGTLALVVFCSLPTFLGALIAILILGISDSIGLVSQNSYFISLPSSENLGHGKALSFYSAMKKIGQLTGPALFGVAISLGAVLGVGTIAAGYLITSLGFAVMNRKR